MNSALYRLGQSPVTDFGENTGTGLIQWNQYNQQKKTLLRKVPWSFARKWTLLSQLIPSPLPMDILPNSAAPGSISYSSAYQLPLDCVRVFRFSPKDAHWRIVGRQIYTDAVPNATSGLLLGLQPLGSDGPDNQPPTPNNPASQNLGIEYIYDVQDPSVFDDSFTDAFIWFLTMNFSFGVTGMMEIYNAAKDAFTTSIADAAALNGMENWSDEFWNTDLTDVRYGYTGTTIQGV